MLRIYLDTNIYIIGFQFRRTNSALILEQVHERGLNVNRSDHLFNELFEYFRRIGGKDQVGLIREYLISVPNNEYIERTAWAPYIRFYKDLITDVDDIPHICCYFANDCNFFVTTNRRLTRQKIGNKVNFMNPYEFVKFLGLEPIETKDGV